MYGGFDCPPGPSHFGSAHANLLGVLCFDVFSFEGGGALPEYASREGCVVEVTGWGKAASRKKSRSRLRVA